MSDDRLRRSAYQFFTKDHDVGDAVRSFRVRYGALPAEKPWTDDRYLYVGPVPVSALPASALPEGAERSMADTVLRADGRGSAAQVRLP